MTHRQDDPKPAHQPTRILLRPRNSNPEQKRGFDRTTTNREVHARLEDAAEPVNARLLNISPTGLQLAVDQVLANGASIEVDALPDRMLLAIVKWSKQMEDHVVLGAEWDAPISIDDVWKVRALDNG
jgi:hypothetical protein